ncbi:hypothetical protein K2173_005329 [Erythroxylum novogranatense]|uniref:Uncharacterized protein n=1 Tax=Erythroxylum novogranatense TaxID=1862640 RepID=A0AAV8TKF6_9ROSI|nr:hypothetical protein K2173_005329 [Erythroxylum novogranatense]
MGSLMLLVMFPQRRHIIVDKGEESAYVEIAIGSQMIEDGQITKINLLEPLQNDGITNHVDDNNTLSCKDPIVHMGDGSSIQSLVGFGLGKSKVMQEALDCEVFEQHSDAIVYLGCQEACVQLQDETSEVITDSIFIEAETISVVEGGLKEIKDVFTADEDHDKGVFVLGLYCHMMVGLKI